MTFSNIGKSLLLFAVGLTAVFLGLVLIHKGIDLSPTIGGLVVFGLLLMVLPYLPPLKLGLGKDGVTFQTLQEQVADLRQDAAGERASRSALQKLVDVKPLKSEMSAEGNRVGDQNKGKFGGSSLVNGRKLEAVITEIPGTELARVRISVHAVDAGKPLSGNVTFCLHETFKPEDKQTVPVNAAGIAQIEVTCYGAFTVGAEADDGRTLLELNLKDQPGAFEPWSKR